jgi:hypothetical protein
MTGKLPDTKRQRTCALNPVYRLTYSEGVRAEALRNDFAVDRSGRAEAAARSPVEKCQHV